MALWHRDSSHLYDYEGTNHRDLFGTNGYLRCLSFHIVFEKSK